MTEVIPPRDAAGTQANADHSLLAAVIGQTSVADRILALEGIWRPRRRLPVGGGHVYVHPTGLCPVACRHCMYGSTLELPGKVHLDEADLDRLGPALDRIRPEKLTFSGGGEPFLRLAQCLRIIERSDCPRIEFVTAANWAGSPKRALAALQLIAAAANGREVNIRLSIDSYHWDAPRPVSFEHYRSVLAAFSDVGALPLGMQLSFRSLIRERDLVKAAFIREFDAVPVDVNDWNTRLVFPCGLECPLTFNVMRFGAAATANGIEREPGDIGLIEYFQGLAGVDNLSLSNVLNDASSGRYGATSGAAFTFDFDGSVFIFGATPPDWRGCLSEPFETNIRFFECDPLTRALFRKGAGFGVELLERVNPARAKAAMASEDIANLLSLLFADPRETAICRLAALRMLVADGEGRLLVEPAEIDALAAQLLE